MGKSEEVCNVQWDSVLLDRKKGRLGLSKV